MQTESFNGLFDYLSQIYINNIILMIKIIKMGTILLSSIVSTGDQNLIEHQRISYLKCKPKTF